MRPSLTLAVVLPGAKSAEAGTSSTRGKTDSGRLRTSLTDMATSGNWM